MYKYKVIFLGLELVTKGSSIEDVQKRVQLSVKPGLPFVVRPDYNIKKEVSAKHEN